MTMYRISWEHVSLGSLYKYSNADPTLYKNTTQIAPNSQIPDEDWHPISRETNSPWQQYNTLREWADADTGFVRNVKLEQMASEPEWREVDPSATTDGGSDD